MTGTFIVQTSVHTLRPEKKKISQSQSRDEGNDIAQSVRPIVLCGICVSGQVGRAIFSGRSSRILHRNASTEKARKDTLQGLGSAGFRGVPPPPRPLIFRLNWDPKGQKIIFWRPPPIPYPLSEDLDPPLLDKSGLLLYTALYLGLGPQFASGFSWYLRSFFCLEAGLAPGFASNDTCITGSLLRMAAPGEFSFFRFTGLSFSQHLMMSQTTSEDNDITEYNLTIYWLNEGDVKWRNTNLKWGYEHLSCTSAI